MAEEEKDEMGIGEAGVLLARFEKLFRKVSNASKALQKAAGLESDVSSLHVEEDTLKTSILKLKNERMGIEEDNKEFKADIAEKEKLSLEEFGNSIELAQKVHDEKLAEIKTNEAADKLSYDEMMTGHQENLRKIQAETNTAQKKLNAIQDKRAAIERLVSEIKAGDKPKTSNPDVDSYKVSM